MVPFDDGIAYHIHYVRLDMDTTLRLKQEAARLGLPVSDVFRRAVNVYFETIGTVSPLPESQVSESPSPALSDDSGAPVGPLDDDDGRFNLLGDGKEE